MKTKQAILLRKSLHLALIIPFGIFWYISIQSYESAQEYARLFLAIWVILFLIYEYIRLDTKLWVPFSQFVKPKELNSSVDGLNLVLAGIVAHSVFPFPIAVTAILIAIIGDTSSTVGAMYGTMKVFPKTDNKTTWEGIILSAVVNILIAISVLGWSYVPIVMAIAGVIIESFVVKLDDNLAIPLGVAFLGQILS